jgi:hypothetical protein
VVVAALVAEQHNVKLRRIINKERRRLRMVKGKQKKDRKVTELKFHSVGDRTRRRILERLRAQEVELFLFIFDLAERRGAFDAFIAEKAGRLVAITHGDSNLDAGVGLTDFVAGAVLYRCRQGDSRFEEIFREKVVWESSGKWKNKW